MIAPIIRLVGPNQAVEILGVKLVGIDAENGRKLLFTLGFVAAVLMVGVLLRRLSHRALRGRGNERADFWTRQTLQLLTAALLLVGLVSIWFDEPTRLATGFGLVTAGLAFALQKAVSAVAAYFVILRRQTFNAILVFGAFMSRAFLAEIPWGGWLFAVLARPLALALFGSPLDCREWIAAAWFGPKGFAPVVYGLLVVNGAMTGADLMFHVIAPVTAMSIVAHSSTDVIIARWFRRTSGEAPSRTSAAER